MSRYRDHLALVLLGVCFLAVIALLVAALLITGSR